VLEQALAVAAAKAKLAGLVIAAAAIGGTAVAAGSTAFVPSSGDETVTVTATDSPSPDVEPTVEPTDGTTEEAAPAATEAPAATLPPCPADVKNHGAYVSSVARDKSVTGRDHGKLVSEAAHSDCGKQAGDDADEQEATEAPEPAESEAADADEQSGDDQDEADDSGDTPKPHKSGKKHGHH
jgi:hypothetical protein